jgi:hypothetical protein
MFIAQSLGNFRTKEELPLRMTLILPNKRGAVLRITYWLV